MLKAADYRAAKNYVVTLGQWLPEAEQKHLFCLFMCFLMSDRTRKATKRDCTPTRIYQSRHLFWEICDSLYFSNSPVCAKDWGVDKWDGWRQSAFDYHTPINFHFGSHIPGFKTKLKRWQPRLQSLSLCSGSGSHQKGSWIIREGNRWEPLCLLVIHSLN